MRFWNRSLLSFLLKVSVFIYKSPSNLNYSYNLGFLLFILLLGQLISGTFVAMFYVASSDYAFFYVYNMVTEVYFGWFVRYIHVNGASFFFLILYFHMMRGIYYCSFLYPRQ